MKLVFAHDHKLRCIDGKYYTLGGLSDQITGKYLNFFEELTIYCRVIPKQNFDTQLFELKDSRVHVKPVSNGSLIIKKESLDMMENEIKNSDALIVKLHSVIAEHAIRFARKYNKPYLIELVGDPWDAYWNHSYSGKVIAPFMTWLTRREVKRAPFVLYVTREYLEKKYPTNGKWIDCSDVEILEFNDAVLKKRLEKINSMGKKIIIGTLAQIDVLYKGQEYVIRAMGKMNNKNIIYRLAGSGNKERLEKIAKECGVLDQVEFCGVLSHSEVFSWLDEIDFYIQPSKQEGLPRSMVEAMSRALPAAGSNVGGISELVESNYIFPKGDIDAIVSMLSGIETESLLEQAVKNYNSAKYYDKSILEKRRFSFYNDFYIACKSNS